MTEPTNKARQVNFEATVIAAMLAIFLVSSYLQATMNSGTADEVHSHTTGASAAIAGGQ